MKICLNILFLCLFSTAMFGQSNKQMARLYYGKGEFDKALTYFKKINNNDIDPAINNLYIDCLIRAKQYKDAEKRVLKIIRNNPKDYDKQILLGEILEKSNHQEDAIKQYKYLIQELPPSSREVINLYKTFKAHGKNDWALNTLKQGRKLLKDTYPLNFQFAEIYGLMGETDKMYDEYLGLVDFSPSYKWSVQNILSRFLHFETTKSEDYNILQSKIIQRIQSSPSKTAYTEMLIWLFVQKEDFASALTQAKALDKRLNEGGKRVYLLGKKAMDAKKYYEAKKCFEYVKTLGKASPYFEFAEMKMLHAVFLDITENKSFITSDLASIKTNYEAVIQHTKNRDYAYELQLEYAEILAFYAQQPEKAKTIIQKALQTPEIYGTDKARGKVLLADINVLTNDIWDASLLYMQVEDAFKFEPIGDEAKYKNARIFYFDGEFKYAQSQLDVLKASTSKLIANDAMQLSIFITDNLGIDSNVTAMKQFAKADLLIEQHQYQKAFQLLDSITTYFPFHGLADDVLMKKAEALKMQGKWSEAIPYLEKIYQDHKDDILADDAVFQLAKIYENHLNDNENAKKWYKKILFEFKGSLHVVQARKHFRLLS